MDDLVAEVRAFNRFYTRVIGVLGAGMHDTPYSLTEARVLFELRGREEMETGELRRLLGLDAGHLSRMLARFEDGGLVTRARSAADARKQVVRLAPHGADVSAALDAASASEVRGLLTPLTGDERRRLTSSMAAIRRILDGGPRREPYVIRPPRPGDLGWIVHRHGVLYAEEYGWDETFEASIADIVAGYVRDHDPKREACWIAEVEGEPAGSIMCVREDDRTARLRLLLVEPSTRGMGIGARLVEECLSFARRAGYTRIVLMTVEVLAAARRIYQRAGFELDEQHREHAHGAEITRQNWSRDL
ncbi:MarR family transcriptional regulator [Sphaerisporangium siamense]|uniref:DNA-binding MarR family transcriptional regulator/GNAT superfamily N-acetyltransferase n=1 Tax=Sphaerisporangium siamense TaxID=795645 RepID=A0A7W7DF53_9ACTN|nr:bifunctional helix-turn-helix transcriptional regulator/GNAT family N-acetyltransferase [Sphaerisporangium siamense]MBB4704885.1 DNA-binding MarR family transcriptional regulator/GNAT superfamily N-acetyltransferase [Sphaerisporangium siamense]GII83687.1 MarR family transcriptional regulator [Sphaerisporangium siamense]